MLRRPAVSSHLVVPHCALQEAKAEAQSVGDRAKADLADARQRVEELQAAARQHEVCMASTYVHGLRLD